MNYRSLRDFCILGGALLWLAPLAACDSDGDDAETGDEAGGESESALEESGAEGASGITLEEGEEVVIADETVPGEGEWSFELEDMMLAVYVELEDDDPDEPLGYVLHRAGEDEPSAFDSRGSRTNQEVEHWTMPAPGEFVIEVHGGEPMDAKITIKYWTDVEE